MKLSSINEWLTLAANIGVLGGIIFLGIEFQQNTQMMHSQTRDAITEKQLAMYGLIVGDTEANDVFVRGRNQEELSDAESFRFGVMNLAIFRVLENEWYQYQQGLFEKEEFEPRIETWKSILIAPGSEQAWRASRLSFAPDFRAQVDSILD